MNQQNLIELLITAINKKKYDMKEYSHKLDITLPEKIEIATALKKDINKIIDMDMNKINAIIDELALQEEKKAELKNHLDVIKALLTLNRSQQTSYTLAKDQMAALTVFIERLESYIDKKNTEQEAIDPEYNEIISITTKYKNLLMQLKNPNNKKLIADMDTISYLFQENQISEDKKQVILLALLKYNQELTNSLISLQEKKVKDLAQLSETELKKALAQFGYNYDILAPTYQQELLKFGSLKNITEVLLTLQKENFPKLEEESQGLILTAILLYSNKKTATEIIKLAQQKGIRIEQLPTICAILLDQTKSINSKLKIKASSIDFKDNVALLSERGISIPYVVETCKELLIIPSQYLRYNIDIFEKYGFSIAESNKSLLSASLSSLKAKNFTRIVDLFIETHPLGLEYMKDNLSVISQDLLADDLLFYKLYQSQVVETEGAFRLTVSEGIQKLQLRGAITNNQISYQGIQDKKTALEITKAYQVPIVEKDTLDKLLEKDNYHIISDQIFDNQYIKILNRFSDRDETLIYDINGIRISKLKVLRIYDILLKNTVAEDLNSLLYAITYNTILTKEQYQKLVIDIKTATGIEEM